MTAATDRFLALDTVRGVAVMGILLLNIIGFAMPAPAYFNPAAYGGDTGIDLVAWLVNFVLFDGKMRGLFSLLFGASLLLVADRAAAKGEHPAQVHYSRMIWLLVFGLIHMWLIWWGDILTYYALVGMIAYGFRDARIRTLIVTGLGLLLIQLLVTAFIPLGVLMAQAEPGDPELAATLVDLERGFGTPPQSWIAGQIDLHRSGWWTIAIDRFGEMQFMPLIGLLQFGWETLAYMLFGMAGLRSGMLTGAWPRTRYVAVMAIGFGIALPGYALLAAWMMWQQFSLVVVAAAAMPATVPLRLFAVIGWACLIILSMRPGGALTTRVAAAGRMAFSNYLGTSLVCTTLFYGYGAGWYGQLSRAALLLMVFTVWALILLWSRPWLDRFAYGPLEWLWRSLSRGRVQRLRRDAPDHTIANATQ